MKHSPCSLLALVVLAASPAPAADLARYVLPPGNYGGVVFTVHSTDQLPLYSGLTPLRDNITLADIDQHYLPEDFQPIEPSNVEVTGRAGLQLFYDSYGIPHVYGQTRADVAFGAGWTTARCFAARGRCSTTRAAASSTRRTIPVGFFSAARTRRSSTTRPAPL